MTVHTLRRGRPNVAAPSGPFVDDFTNVSVLTNLFNRAANNTSGPAWTWSVYHEKLGPYTSAGAKINATSKGVQADAPSGTVRVYWSSPSLNFGQINHYAEASVTLLAGTDRWGPAVRCDTLPDATSRFYMLGIDNVGGYRLRLDSSVETGPLQALPDLAVGHLVRIEAIGATIRIRNLTLATSADYTAPSQGQLGTAAGWGLNRNFGRADTFGTVFRAFTL